MTKTKTGDWLRLANDDIVVAVDAQKREIYHLTCFHAQQAAEKLLKALLAERETIIPKVHSLMELYGLTVVTCPGLKEYKQSLQVLDNYYIPTRYPDALPGSLEEGLPIAQDAAQAIGDVQELQEFIEKAISPTSRKML